MIQIKLISFIRKGSTAYSVFTQLSLRVRSQKHCSENPQKNNETTFSSQKRLKVNNEKAKNRVTRPLSPNRKQQNHYKI